jgi:hypothetical protein
MFVIKEPEVLRRINLLLFLDMTQTTENMKKLWGIYRHTDTESKVISAASDTN